MLDDQTRLKVLRKNLKLSINNMAAALGLSGSGAGDKVRAMEAGARDITGPILKIMQHLEAELLALEYLKQNDIESKNKAIDLLMQVSKGL